MKTEITLTLLDLEAAVYAMDSWRDAFAEEQPEDAERVSRAIEAVQAAIDEMKGPQRPVLRLVKPEDIQ